MAVATVHEVDLEVLEAQLRPMGVETASDLDVDPDGLPVYCESSGGTARTQGGFCLNCGAHDHEYV